METEFCQSTLPHKFADVRSSSSCCVKQPPAVPLLAEQLGFQPYPSAGTGTGLAAPSGFPTLKTMQVVYSPCAVVVASSSGRAVSSGAAGLLQSSVTLGCWQILPQALIPELSQPLSHKGYTCTPSMP